MARTLEDVARELGMDEGALLAAAAAAPDPPRPGTVGERLAAAAAAVRERRVSVTPTTSPSPRVLTSLPPEIRLAEQEGVAVRTHVILIGAGGVGARLAPLLVKHLIAGDALTIVDHDLVETKNLTRQHFIPADVGRPKAVVVAERAEAAAPSAGVIVTPVQQKAEGVSAIMSLCPQGDAALAPWVPETTINGRAVHYNTLVVSAIDSREGRRGLAGAVDAMTRTYAVHDSRMSLAWVDCGNDMLAGQALVAFLFGKCTVRPVGEPTRTRVCRFDGWQALAPGFLEREDEPTPDCGVRIDTQSVLANTWAATAAATLAVPFITGAPIGSVGISFSIRTGGTRTVSIARVDDSFRFHTDAKLLA